MKHALGETPLLPLLHARCKDKFSDSPSLSNMDFFKSVFSDDPPPSDSQLFDSSPKPSEVDDKAEEEENRDQDDLNSIPNPNSTSSGGVGSWSFGGLMKTIASKSESVIQTYRRDLEEFSSGLKMETAAIREVVKELPLSLEVGASVAQESLESVGQAIDDIGASVWKGTAQIISQGRDVLLAADSESDSSDIVQKSGELSVNLARYSRFESQVRSIQSDPTTFSVEPEDLDDFGKWKLGFVLDEKGAEIDNLLEDNGIIEGIYSKLVPSAVDSETFWRRYFYRIHKLKQAEDARANLVKRAISGEEEEDLSWDVDDEDYEEPSNVSEVKVKSIVEFDNRGSSKVQTGHNEAENLQVGTSVVEEKSSKRENDDKGVVEKPFSDNRSDEEPASEEIADVTQLSGDTIEAIADERKVFQGKAEANESCKDSDVSVVSTQPSLPEEEDLGWDEIEDIGSNDENKVTAVVSPTGGDLRKRLSAADEDEDLSWDIEDDDEPAKS